MKMIILLLPFLAVLAGCGKEPLAPLDTALDQMMGYGSVDAHFCTSAPSPAKQYLKYLFILDHSASNKPGFPSPLTPNDVSNTDPNGDRRYGPMVNFIQNLTPDPNNVTYFSLIDFNDQAELAQTLTGFDPSATHFVNNIANPDWIGSGTQASPSPNDSGFTNYSGALQLAYQLIQQDAQAAAGLASSPIVTSQYVIVFVSDGVPTVATPNGPNPTYTQTFTTDLQPVIASIMNLKNDPQLGQYISSITLNTAYYFDTQQLTGAETLLQQMASAGDGQYVQFGSGENILYQLFAPPSREIVNQLVDVFVQNENAVWWPNGQFMTDSDGDGLPDSIELQMGSNPYAADSDGNGVNDFVEYITKGKPCDDPNCLAANRDQYAFCDGYSPVTASDGTVTFSSSANDGLNDCEKFVLGGSVGNFNSNGDLIPDYYAAVNTLSIIPGSAGTAQADPFGDGLSNYSKLKLGLPIPFSIKSLVNVSSRSTSLTVESAPSSDVTCYHYTVGDIALSASANNIKVMVIQNSSAIQNKPFLMNAVKAIDSTGTATFGPGDFQ